MQDTLDDPRGLMTDAFLISGIDAGECRAIFLDWALGLPAGKDVQVAVQAVLLRFKDAPQDHPMIVTLQEALSDAPVAQRRGGRGARIGY